ncbi:hypothetical protein NDU88_003287 [Pleurodeles waltl]|uniref:Uncharacterized protein n=1 Tax=Pleurodeles waltl TaxID=8319 RepID=A0AAV7UZL2_PLEWA|nr:hypothetical protein NDU88_003287 [Pleurodeles waltl]
MPYIYQGPSFGPLLQGFRLTYPNCARKSAKLQADSESEALTGEELDPTWVLLGLREVAALSAACRPSLACRGVGIRADFPRGRDPRLSLRSTRCPAEPGRDWCLACDSGSGFQASFTLPPVSKKKTFVPRGSPSILQETLKHISRS